MAPPAYIADDIVKLVDTTLEEGYIEIAVNADEYYIFPHQIELNPISPVNRIEFYRSTQHSGNVIFFMGTKLVFGIPDAGYQGTLYLFKTMGAEFLETTKKGCYVLIHTGHSIPAEQQQYGTIIAFENHKSKQVSSSILRKQL